MNKHQRYESYMAKYQARRRLVLTPYFGGKVRLSAKLIPLMPPLPHYIEPFGGSAAVLINRPPADGREIYADLKHSMVVLMSEIRDDRERMIWRLRFTPYSRRGYNEAKARLKDAAVAIDPAMREGWRRNRSVVPSTDAGGSAARQNVAGERFGGSRATLVSANRLGVAADANELNQESVWGAGHGFGTTRVDKPNSASAAARQGIAVDESEVRAHSVFGTVGGFGTSVDAETVGAPKSVSVAARQGLAADAQETLSHGVYGLSEGFGIVRSAQRAELGQGGETTSYQSAANRLGVAADIDTVHEQAMMSSDQAGWRANASEKSQTEPIATRQGVQSGASMPAMPAGYVVTVAGAVGVETLLSYPPTKCETIVDDTNEIYDMFRAAREYPNRMLSAGVERVGNVSDAIRMARRVLRTKPETVDPLPAWRRIADTWYGGMLWRLKRAQVESKPAQEVVESYKHPTSAMISRPWGRGEYLGRCLPMADTPLHAVAERLAGVETYCADALDMIAEWRDCEDALIYLDPPYVHGVRKGKNDYEHEMSDVDHERLLALVKDARAHIIISGYDNPLYANALAGWRIADWRVNASSAVGKNGRGRESGRSTRTERVWFNYEIADWRPTQSALL